MIVQLVPGIPLVARISITSMARTYSAPDEYKKVPTTAIKSQQPAPTTQHAEPLASSQVQFKPKAAQLGNNDC